MSLRTAPPARSRGGTRRAFGSTAGDAAGRGLSRVLGLGLLLLTLLPLHRLLEPARTGLAGRATVALTETNRALLLSGLVLALIPTLLGARFLRDERVAGWLRGVGRVLERPRTLHLALGVAALSALLTASFSLGVLHGKPNLIDAMAQLAQARYLAAGRLAGPGGPDAAFWHIQNTVITDQGWVSQYPPGHVALLALGIRLGAPWVVGPALAAVTSFFTFLLAERLLRRRSVARAAGILVGVSPFLLCLAGDYMSHITAAALAAVGLWAALRARDGSAAWAAIVGSAGGAMLATRPLSAISLLAVPALVAWLPQRRAGARWWLPRVGLAAAAAAPFVVALMLYNAHFFGAPLRFGYIAALGPEHGLGFHRDPWGNLYGLREAVGYTSSDLAALSLYLLEIPLPLVALVGFAWLSGAGWGEGERVLAAWALTPVVANAFYWHHGLFMGPRMLDEAAPAWVLLVVASVADLTRRTPGRLRGGRVPVSPRAGLIAGTAAALLAGLVLAPQRALSYGGGWMHSTRLPPPRPGGAAVVFVHGGWTERLASTLAASGMRLDSVEAALSRNSTCEVQAYVDAQLAGVPTPRLTFDPAAAPIAERDIAPDDAARFRPGERLGPGCLREIRADRGGVFPLAPLLWQGVMPGTSGDGALFVRDLGPRRNEALLRRLPGRRAYALVSRDPGETPHLAPYAASMAWLWGEPRPAEAP